MTHRVAPPRRRLLELGAVPVARVDLVSTDRTHEIRGARRAASAYVWTDPTELAEAAQQHNGRDFFARLVKEEPPAPPINATVGMPLVEAVDGRSVFELEPMEWHFILIGTVHGGILATLADSALGCAVHSNLPRAPPTPHWT